jgi:Protein of unknown function (DUF642)
MKHATIFFVILAVNCAHLNKGDDDGGEVASLELDKVALYKREQTAAPTAGAALPSQYLKTGENILINGSFESPVLTSLWATYAADSVSGWQASWVDTTCALAPRIELQSKDMFSNSPDQGQYTELDADNACTADARIKLMQSFASEANHIYKLSFWVRARDAQHAMGLNVKAGENFTMEIAPAADGWQVVTVYIEATSSVTTIAFTETGDGDTFGTLLDAVEVREITVDMDALQRDRGGKGKGPRGQRSFPPGRRHKDCNRGK